MLTSSTARDVIQRMAGCRILVIGDVMLDHFIWGAVRRISPEAPVPIVEVTRETTFPGGAANVARNLSAFTPHAYLMGRVGKDSAAGKLVCVDPSPHNPLNWSGASLVKPNRLEAFAAAGVQDQRSPGPPLQDTRLLEVGGKLLDQWNVSKVLITLGEQGMILFQRDCPPHHIPTRAREVYDVSGAGDTAIAFLTLALAAGLSAEDAADLANHASGIVVGKLGTARVMQDELQQAFED